MSRPAVRAIVADVEAQIARLERRDVPSVRLVRRTLSRTLAKVDAAVVLAVADDLTRRGDWPYRLIALELAAGHKATFAALDRTRVLRWSRGLSSWETVDLFGCTTGGQAWRAGLLTDADVDSWARSADRWQRRLALVCTV